MIGSLGGYSNVLGSSYISKLYATENTTPVEAIQKREGQGKEQPSDELSLSAAGMELIAMLESKPEVQPVAEPEAATSSRSAEIIDDLANEAGSEVENSQDEDESDSDFAEKLNEKLAERRAESDSAENNAADSEFGFDEINGGTSSDTGNSTEYRPEPQSSERGESVRSSAETDSLDPTVSGLESMNFQPTRADYNSGAVETLESAAEANSGNSDATRNANSEGFKFGMANSYQVASAYAANSTMASNQLSLTQLLAQFSSRGG